MNEQDYLEGSRMAWLSMLRTCLKELGVDDPEAERVRWVIERQETVRALREVCGEHGDNNWPDDRHLEVLWRSTWPGTFL